MEYGANEVRIEVTVRRLPHFMRAPGKVLNRHPDIGEAYVKLSIAEIEQWSEPGFLQLGTRFLVNFEEDAEGEDAFAGNNKNNGTQGRTTADDNSHQKTNSYGEDIVDADTFQRRIDRLLGAGMEVAELFFLDQCPQSGKKNPRWSVELNLHASCIQVWVT